MVAAMKARQEARLSALRMIKAAAHEAEGGFAQAARRGGRNAGAQVTHQTAHRRRRRVSQGRPAASRRIKEEAERAADRKLPPRPLPPRPELDEAVAAALAETGVTSLKQMGVVMKAAQARLAGKTVDGKALSEKVRSHLQ